MKLSPNDRGDIFEIFSVKNGHARHACDTRIGLATPTERYCDVRYGMHYAQFPKEHLQIWKLEHAAPSHLKDINISRERFKSALRLLTTWFFVQAIVIGDAHQRVKNSFKRRFTNAGFD